MNDWQPIETAPKDGREVIILVSGREIYPKVMSAAWYAATTDNGWWVARAHVLDDGDVEGWMPLPNPPASHVRKG